MKAIVGLFGTIISSGNDRERSDLRVMCTETLEKLDRHDNTVFTASGDKRVKEPYKKRQFTQDQNKANYTFN